MKKIFLLISLFFCVNKHSCFADEVTEYKKILYGRKDLIRNSLVTENTKLCISAIGQNIQSMQTLNNILLEVRDENKILKQELAECKAKKTK